MSSFAHAAAVSVLASILIVISAHADEMTLGEVKAKAAAPLSKQDLEALLPGSTYQMQADKWRQFWKNEPDGKLSGSKSNGWGVSDTPINGTWRVTDRGLYCVDGKGRTDDEVTKWCRVIWKVGDQYFGFGAGAKDDAVKSIAFTLKK